MICLKQPAATLLALVFLTVLLFVFTLPFKEKTYIFDWDQSNDYQSVAKIVLQKKPALIGPRVTGDTGFFLSPWHYYFLLPFFIITNGSLYMGFWASLFVQLILLIVVFLLCKKWFGFFTAFFSALFFATPVSLLSWGFMYIPLLSLIFLNLCLKTFNRPQFFPLLSLFFAFGCSTYAVFYALGLPFLFLAIKLLKNGQLPPKKLFLSFVLLFVPFLPILIFDLRHDFLNIKNVINFSSNQLSRQPSPWYFLIVFYRALENSFLNKYILAGWSSLLAVFCLSLLAFGINVFGSRHRLFIFLWIFAPLLFLSFFHGTTSEYYYGTTIILLPILLSRILTRKLFGKAFLIIFTLFVIFLRIKQVTAVNTGGVTLADKITVVNKLNQLNTLYSLSYDLDAGYNAGFDTILSKMGKNFYADGSAQLYTVTCRQSGPIGGTKIADINNLSIYKR